MKEIKGHTEDQEELQQLEEEWQREVQTHKDFRILCHPNIIEFIAAITRDEKRYLMFRWADGGNLRQFWRQYKRPIVSPALVRDIIIQLRGLAEGLEKLHLYGGGTGSYRHGDLKPENILRVRTKKENESQPDVGILKISDMGLAKHHTVNTKYRAATKMKYTTVRYQAPEVVLHSLSGKARSRRFDIWSMGCVTLEFIVWLLYGNKELDLFNKSIVGKFGEEVPFYQIKDDDGMEKAIVHPAVDAAMDTISRDQECKGHTAINDLFGIVRNQLLVVNLGTAAEETRENSPSQGSPKQTNLFPMRRATTLINDEQESRASASVFREKLDDIISNGDKNKLYWFTGKKRDHITRMQTTPVTSGPNAPDSHLSVDFRPRRDSKRVKEQSTPGEVSLAIPTRAQAQSVR